MDIRSKRVAHSIPLAQGFEGDSRNGDELRSDWCVICNPFSAYPVLVGRTVEDAVNFQLAIGPAGEVFREAGKEAEAKRGQIEAALAEAINSQKKDADGIVMDSSSWVISGKNPV